MLRRDSVRLVICTVGYCLVLQRSGGKDFQRWGADQLKALFPRVARQVVGTVRYGEEEGLREQEGVAVWTMLNRRGEVIDSLKCI